MSRTRPYQHLSSAAYKTRVPPLRLLSQAEMIARIELARSEEAPPCCPTCGSTTAGVTETRRCTDCGVQKPLLTAFARNRSKPRGRDYLCKSCKRERDQHYWPRRKRREILGESV